MKLFRNTLTLILLSICAFGLHAQITLNNGNFPRPASDTITMATADSSLIMMPTTGPDQVWDYSGIGKTGENLTEYVAASNPDYPTATRAIAQGVDFGGFPLDAELLFELNANGYYALGTSIVPISIDLEPFTFGPGDSLLITNGLVEISPAQPTMVFPTTYNDSWTETSTIVMDDIIVTVALAGMDHDTIRTVRHTTVTSTVVGYGTLQIPTLDGKSEAYAALLVEDEVISEDSMYTNGAPSDPALLQLLGQTQGQITFEPAFRFFVEGVPAPCLVINGDSGWSAITDAEYYQGPEIMTVGLWENLKKDLVNVTAFPNPTADGIVNLQFFKADAHPWTVSFMDLQGRIVHSEMVNGPSGEIDLSVEFPASMTTGTYLFSLSNEEAVVVGGGKVILK